MPGPKKPAPHRTLVRTISLTLPETLIEKYQQQTGTTLPDAQAVMEERLEQCADYHFPALHFDGSDLEQLQHLIGIKATDCLTVLGRIEDLKSVSVAGCKIKIDKEVLLRLQSRVWKGDTLQHYLSELLDRVLREEVGL